LPKNEINFTANLKKSINRRLTTQIPTETFHQKKQEPVVKRQATSVLSKRFLFLKQFVDFFIDSLLLPLLRLLRHAVMRRNRELCGCKLVCRTPCFELRTERPAISPVDFFQTVSTLDRLAWPSRQLTLTPRTFETHRKIPSLLASAIQFLTASVVKSYGSLPTHSSPSIPRRLREITGGERDGFNTLPTSIKREQWLSGNDCYWIGISNRAHYLGPLGW
jgi:hypothetical protein